MAEIRDLNWPHQPPQQLTPTATSMVSKWQYIQQACVSPGCVCGPAAMSTSTWWDSNQKLAGVELAVFFCCWLLLFWCWDAPLPTTVVNSVALSNYILLGSSNKPGDSPLISFINTVFRPEHLPYTDVFCFHTIRAKPCCVWKSVELSSFWNTGHQADTTKCGNAQKLSVLLLWNTVQ